jgi:hypothetical protein
MDDDYYKRCLMLSHVFMQISSRVSLHHRGIYKQKKSARTNRLDVKRRQFSIVLTPNVDQIIASTSNPTSRSKPLNPIQLAIIK